VDFGQEKQIMKATQTLTTQAALMAGLLLGLTASANAQLLHRYDFTTDASDSVGTAHGSLFGGATLIGGALTTAGGNGAVNGTWGGTGPRLTLDSSAVSGISGAFTIESWFTCTTGWPKFDTLYAFSDGTVNNYLLGAPVRGYSPWPSGVGIKGAGGAGDGNWDQIVSGIYLDTPGIHQTMLTYDGTTFRYYVDGALADFSGLSATAVDPGFNLSTLTYIGINGGSPWNDPSLTGSTYDFRIYGQSLTAGQVASVYNLGADASTALITEAITPVPEPSAMALAGVALVVVWARSRRSQA
jgi:hypothetical protein